MASWAQSEACPTPHRIESPSLPSNADSLKHMEEGVGVISRKHNFSGQEKAKNEEIDQG